MYVYHITFLNSSKSLNPEAYPSSGNLGNRCEPPVSVQQQLTSTEHACPCAGGYAELLYILVPHYSSVMASLPLYVHILPVDSPIDICSL